MNDPFKKVLIQVVSIIFRTFAGQKKDDYEMIPLKFLQRRKQNDVCESILVVVGSGWIT